VNLRVSLVPNILSKNCLADTLNSYLNLWLYLPKPVCSTWYVEFSNWRISTI